MQAANVSQQPTQQQVSAQIDLMHWQQKQQEQANLWNQQQQQRQQGMAHTEYIVDHVAIPASLCFSVVIAAITIIYLVRKSIASSIIKNRDDNAANVEEAKINAQTRTPEPSQPDIKGSNVAQTSSE